MSETLKIQNKPDDYGRSVFILTGRMDDSADYSQADLSGLTQVVFDFQNVDLINSIGIQKWVRFLATADDRAHIVFTRCPLRVVNQINLFPGFTAGKNVSIHSFEAPYYCENCDDSANCWTDPTELSRVGESVIAPYKTCPSCNEELQFDAVEAKFFQFLDRLGTA